jgi:hypothetical protein
MCSRKARAKQKKLDQGDRERSLVRPAKRTHKERRKEKEKWRVRREKEVGKCHPRRETL